MERGSAEEQLAWAAGLFEAEGCFSNRKKFGSPDAKLSMTDEDVVRRFAAIISLGKVTEVRSKNANRKALWQWRVSRATHVREVTQSMLPWLGQRRAAKAHQLMPDLIRVPPAPSERLLQIAWAAGLFEGEGHFGLANHGTSGVLVLRTSDEDVVRRFGLVIGHARISGGEKPSSRYGKKPMWLWRLNRASDICKVIQWFLPWLGQRRRIEGLELLHVVERVEISPRDRTHCPAGHPYDAENTRIVRTPSGRGRQCRLCTQERARRRISPRQLPLPLSEPDVPCECGCGELVSSGKRFVRGHWARLPKARAAVAARNAGSRTERQLAALANGRRYWPRRSPNP